MTIVHDIVVVVYNEADKVCDFDKLHNDVGKLVTNNGHVIIFETEGNDLTYSIYLRSENDVDNLISTDGFPFRDDTDAVQKLLIVIDGL